MRITYTQKQSPALRPLGETPKETLTERRIRWSNLLRKQHFQPIIEEVLAEELAKYENSKVIDIKDRVALMGDCALILASASSVFAAAVDGNLTQRFQVDKELQASYTHVQERAHIQPSIYIHLLADDNGTPPSPNQYLIIRDFIEDYVSENKSSDYAWAIDNVSLPTVTKAASAQGYRKYLTTDSRSARRVQTFQTFCTGIQALCLSVHPSLHDVPLCFPPGECGYSRNSHSRLTQHTAHRSSNYIMNLVEDICTYLYRTNHFVQRFHMHQFIIYLIFRPRQAAIAEIFCSGLLQVWAQNGGGFNAYPAGRSVATARKVSENDWESHERWVVERSMLAQNMLAQIQRASEWAEVLEWKEKDAKEIEMNESI